MQNSTNSLIAGRFRVLGFIAEGGMGAVYKVRDEKTGRERALKVLKLQFAANEDFRRRFHTEASVSGRFDSRHVVDVIDTGVDDDSGVPWLAMELLRGETLDHRITRAGALSVADAVRLFRQLHDAIGKAHDAGVLHLDLKPSNIFLMDGDTGDPASVKVLDFGIARVMESGRTHATATTQAGTFAWMAPEQSDAGDKLSPATDVWALGLIAFDALSGRQYWLACNDESSVNQKRLTRESWFDPIVPPSERARALGLSKAFPEGFDAWFARCVDRDVPARFQDANACLGALVTLLEARPPVLAAPLPEPVRFSLPEAPPPAPPPAAPPPRIAATQVGGPAHALVPESPPRSQALSSRPMVERTEVVASSLPLDRTEVMAPKEHPEAPGPVAPRETLDPKRPRPTPWIAAGVAVVLLASVAVYKIGFSGSASADESTHADTGVTTATDAPSGAQAGSAGPELPPPIAAPVLRCPEASVAEPGGTFTMGDDAGDADERPTFTVTLRPFCLDRTEVTVAAYRACAGCVRPAASNAASDHPAIARQPVENVSAVAAQAYCVSRGGRLPTEAEWEFAARNGGSTRYPWGDAPIDATRVNSDLREDSFELVAEVDAFPLGASALGVLNLLGNVAEWTSSPKLPYPNGVQSGVMDGPEPRAFRGGSFMDPPSQLRPTNRDAWSKTAAAPVLGFRCAYDGTLATP